MIRENAPSNSGGKLAVKLVVSLLVLISLFVDAFFLIPLRSTPSVTHAAPQPEPAASGVTSDEPTMKERVAEAENAYPHVRRAAAPTTYYEQLGYIRGEDESTALPADDDELTEQYGELMWMFAHDGDMISEVRAKKVGTKLELYLTIEPLALGYTYEPTTYRVLSVYEGEEYVYAEANIVRTKYTTHATIELDADKIVENDRPVYISAHYDWCKVELDKDQIIRIAQG